jgi:uncharacterized protein (TIGR02466 family)
MFTGTSVQEFFPTPIWMVDLEPGVAGPLNARLLADIERMTSPRPHIAPGATWQTEPDMHKRPQFAEFIGVLRKAITAALKFLEVDYKDFVLTACWANFNPAGGLNSAHTHPNNYISGVYYVSIPAGADVIEFTDPRPAAVANMARAKTLNRFNGNRMTVQAKPGRIVLFPAWLSHSVPVNRTNQERVSIAFNATFTDYAETMSPVLWQGTLPFKRA